MSYWLFLWCSGSETGEIGRREAFVRVRVRVLVQMLNRDGFIGICEV